MFRQAVCDLIRASIHRRSVSPDTAFALIMASSIANLFVNCIVIPLAVGDKNAGPSLQELFVVLEHKFTADHLFLRCAHPINMFLTGRHTACLCSQTAADTLSICLLCQLDTETGTRQSVILACTAEIKWPCSIFKVCMSRIMNTHKDVQLEYFLTLMLVSITFAVRTTLLSRNKSCTVGDDCFRRSSAS